MVAKGEAKHLVTALSVRLSIHPVPCPVNIFKATVGIE